MSVIFVLVPVALALVGTAVIAFVLAARHGQFDDLDTPAIRALHDDVEGKVKEGEVELEREPE